MSLLLEDTSNMYTYIDVPCHLLSIQDLSNHNLRSQAVLRVSDKHRLALTS